MNRSYAFYFLISFGVSLHEKEISLLRILSVYSAVSKNLQQELTTDYCGQKSRKASSFATAMEQKKSQKFT